MFVDSGAFIALIVPEDQEHRRTVEFHRNTPGIRRTLNSVVAETYTHLRYRFPPPTATRFLRQVSLLKQRGELIVDYVDHEIDITAQAILFQYKDVKLSYVDATILAALRLQPDIQRIFGFDEHLRLEGHLLVP